MGTRSLTTVINTTWNDAGDHVLTFYRHWDGYPSAHGVDIANFLEGRILGNGIPHPRPEKFSNGTGRLGTELLCAIQSAGHEPELVPQESDMGQEFHYVITGHANDGTINVKVFDGPITAFGYGGKNCNNPIFEGSAKEYIAWIKTQD